MERLRMTVGAGIGLLGSAGAKAPEGFRFYISGDLNQMAAQKEFLRDNFFEVSQSDVYPVLREEDKPRALRLIYEHSVPGWWHYEEDYAKLGIATKEEFRAKLGAQVEREKAERNRNG